MAIDPEIYADNDADIIITDLPTGLTVQWGIVPLGTGGAAPAASVQVSAIHVDVSGTCAETGTQPANTPLSSTGRYYTATLEGSAITARLLPTYANTSVALLVRAGQDVRVYGVTTVREGRLVT